MDGRVTHNQRFHFGTGSDENARKIVTSGACGCGRGCDPRGRCRCEAPVEDQRWFSFKELAADPRVNLGQGRCAAVSGGAGE